MITSLESSLRLDGSCYNSVLFTWLTSLNRATISADEKIRPVMSSLFWFCALLDWKGITCKYFGFIHRSHYCIFVPLKVCAFAIFLSARALISHILEGKRRHYKIKLHVTWESCEEAEMWSQIAKPTLKFYCLSFHLLPHANSCLVWDTSAPRDMCSFAFLFYKTLSTWNGHD